MGGGGEEGSFLPSIGHSQPPGPNYRLEIGRTFRPISDNSALNRAPFFSSLPMSLIRPSLKASESEGVVVDLVAAAAKLWYLAFQYGLSGHGRIFSIPSFTVNTKVARWQTLQRSVAEP